MSLAITVGTFDGVHIGHQAVLSKLVDCDASATALVFERAPREQLTGAHVRYLCALPLRIDLIRAQGVRNIVPVRFEHLRRLTAADFMHQMRQRYGADTLVLGATTRIGCDRVGDAQLATLARGSGFNYHPVANLTLESEPSLAVSSSAVRQAVTDGDMPLAKLMLGRFFSLAGTVVRGSGRGHKLGYPTANLALESEPSLAVPSAGVYAAYAKIDGQPVPAAVSIGTNPTFNDRQQTIEAYLLDYAADLYNRRLTLEFVELLRPQVTYATPSALQDQIKADIARVRQILALAT